jgi:hypothetical protein
MTYKAFSIGTAFLLAAALPGVAGAQAVLEGSGEQSALDCDGGAAQITGTDNQVTLSGGCTLVKVEGSGNVVLANMASKSAIEVVGTSNKVSWKAPGEAKPRISSTGVGNSITRIR